MKPHRRPQQPSSSENQSPSERSGNIRDAAREDFHSFFEKLSSLDDLKWSSEEESQAIKSKAKSAYRQATTHRRVPSPAGMEETPVAPRPKMNVVKSDSMAAGKEDGNRGVASSVAAAQRSKKITSGDAIRFLKLAMISLILFGLGLGAGWAALSLPDRFQKKMPGLARMIENGKNIEAGDRYQSLANEGMRMIERIKPMLGWGSGGDAENSPAQDMASGSGVSGAENQGMSSPTVGAGPGYREKLANAKKSPLDSVRLPVFSGNNSAPSKVLDSGSGTGIGVWKTTEKTTGKTTEKITGKITAKSNPDASGNAAVVGANSASPRNGAPSHTLQVGACSSFACVENFRKLLLGKVSSNSIQITRQPSADGSKLIQRIRIGPLGKMDAEELKSSLMAMDPQFKGVYIIGPQ